MKSPVFLVCALLLLYITAWSQNPGYMGKKTIAGYGFHVSPVTFGSTADNKTLFGGGYGSAKEGYFRLNYTHDFFIERALSARWLFGASLKYARTGYDNRIVLESTGTPPTGYYQISALTFTPYFKTYYRRYIAPWGRYFVFGPTISRLSAKNDAFMNVSGTINGHDTLYTDFGPSKHYAFDFLMGFGRNRILWNTISLEYGYNFHFLSSLTILESVISDPITGNPRQENYISETIKVRMRGLNRFNVFIKVGYLF